MIERRRPWDVRARRRDRPGTRGLLALALCLSALAGSAGCKDRWPSRVAERILTRYRKVSGVKPLPASGMMHIRLTPDGGAAAPDGRVEILWEPYHRYRESVTSAGMTTVRGIESGSGKAYFTDEDGVTRVASEPTLRELLTRSFFWRRAWLFEDRERTFVYLGPADDRAVSVRMTPEGGNPLVLSFARQDGRLLSARSPRFALDFTSATAFRDLSDPRRPVAGEIVWTGLPTGQIPLPSVGGGRARFAEASSEVAYERRAGALLVPARAGDLPILLAIDGAVDGPLRLSRALAERLALRYSPDVFGRSIAAGGSLQVGSVNFPSLFVQVSEAIPEGADALAGGCLFRESIVELDAAARRLRLHDPARWSIPENYYRIVTDDDENRPVAILSRGKSELRLVEGSDTGDADLWLAPDSAARMNLSGAGQARGLTWGPIPLPALALRTTGEAFFPAWGDDGRLGFPLLARYHVFIDMGRRWTYARPVE